MVELQHKRKKKKHNFTWFITDVFTTLKNRENWFKKEAKILFKYR